MKAKKDLDKIWEAYDERLDNPHHQREVRKLKRENPHLPEMRRKAKEEMKRKKGKKDLKQEGGLEAGEPGKPWGDPTPVLEGVTCSCQDCIYWVVGDRCKGDDGEINLTKIPHQDYGQVVVCETFEAGRN